MSHPENNYGKNNWNLQTGVFPPTDKPKAVGVNPTATMGVVEIQLGFFFKYMAHGLSQSLGPQVTKVCVWNKTPN